MLEFKKKFMLFKKEYEQLCHELEIEYAPHMEQYCEDVLQNIVKQLAENDFDSLLCDFHKRMNVGLTKSERFFARKGNRMKEEKWT